MQSRNHAEQESCRAEIMQKNYAEQKSRKQKSRRESGVAYGEGTISL